MLLGEEGSKTIGLFNDSYPPVMDGVALTVYNYAYWLQKKTGNVTVVTPESPGYIDKEDFQVMRYASLPMIKRKPYRLGTPLFDMSFLYQLNFRKQFSIIHAHSPFSSGQLALLMAKRQKVPLIATFHSKFRDDFQRATKSKKIANLMLKEKMKFFEMADEVWIPQPAVEETIREYGFKGEVQIVDNGTDFAIDVPIEPIKKAARKELNVQEDELMFLFVGQHIWEKNTAMIIHALEKVRNLPYKMFFVGVGYAAEEMKKMVAERKLEDKIFFAGAIYDRETIKKYYAAADLFIFPSIYDNAPLVVREAAALHTPSILAEGSTSSEVVRDGVNGFLIKNNADALAEKITTVASNPVALKIIGDNASTSIARSWENVIEEVLDRYNHLIERKMKK